MAWIILKEWPNQKMSIEEKGDGIIEIYVASSPYGGNDGWNDAYARINQKTDKTLFDLLEESKEKLLKEGWQEKRL